MTRLDLVVIPGPEFTDAEGRSECVWVCGGVDCSGVRHFRRAFGWRLESMCMPRCSESALSELELDLCILICERSLTCSFSVKEILIEYMAAPCGKGFPPLVDFCRRSSREDSMCCYGAFLAFIIGAVVECIDGLPGDGGAEIF